MSTPSSNIPSTYDWVNVALNHNLTIHMNLFRPGQCLCCKSQEDVDERYQEILSNIATRTKEKQEEEDE